MAREWNNLKQVHSAGTQALLADAALDLMELQSSFMTDDDVFIREAPRPVVATGLPSDERYIISGGAGLMSDHTVIWSPTLRRASTPHERARDQRIIGYPFSVGQTIAMELGRLNTGWAGDGTVAPGTKLVLDIQNAAASFPAEASMPEVEVDPDDGSVILRWITSNAERSLSLTFLGKGEVTVFFSSPERTTPARKYEVTDIVGLYNRFNDDLVHSIMAG
ncbi:hypothetical protein [Rhizobium leguminosarum]